MDTIAEQQADEVDVAPAEPKPQVEPRGVVFHAVLAFYLGVPLLYLTALQWGLYGPPDLIEVFVWGAVVFVALVLLSCAYLARLGAWLLSSNRSMERLWVWPVAPLMLVGAILLVSSDFGPSRFERSQPEFDRAVAELEERQFTEGLLVRDPVQIGSYEISRISKVGDAVIFTEYTSSYDSETGLIFAPDGPPPEWDQVRDPAFTDLGDGWYAYHQQW